MIVAFAAIYLLIVCATISLAPDYIVGTIIWSVVSVGLGDSLLRSWREGKITFLQGAGTRLDRSPRKYWAWMVAHGSCWILLNIAFGTAWLLAVSGRL